MKPLLLFALLAIAPSLATPAAGQAEAERVLRTRVVTATFLGWERGDYLWARLDVRGRGRISAMPGDEPIGPFLEARRARPLRLWLATVRVTLPEAGTVEIQRIVRARDGRINADRWWDRLSPAHRRAWLRRYHGAIG